MLLLWHSILTILWLKANNPWHSWCNLGVEWYGENQMMMLLWEFVHPYIVISESIIVKKAETGLDDPNLVSVHMFFYYGHVPYVHGPSKVNWFYCAVVVWSSYCHSRHIYQSIHRGAMAGLILSITTDNKIHYHVLWILDVLSNDPQAGTPNDCVCCFCWLSVHVGSNSICRPWFSWGLVGFWPCHCICKWCYLYIIIHNSIWFRTRL